MVRRFLARGYNDHIFYAESSATTDKLIKIEMNQEEPGSVNKQEVFSLTSSQIVAFDIDCENFQNDANDLVDQSLFIVDDKQEVYHLTCREGSTMKVQNRIKIPSTLNISKLKNQDWMTVHISHRALVVEGFTYSLNSNLCTRLKMEEADKK